MFTFRLFHKTDQRLSRLPQAVRELAETSTKDLNILAGLLSSCSNRGVLSSAGFWQGGPVAAGETKRAGIFETSNPLIRCQKSTRKVARVSVVLPSYFRIHKLEMKMVRMWGHLNLIDMKV